VAYGYTYKILTIKQNHQHHQSSTMLDQLLFRKEDSLPMEWDFIERTEEISTTEGINFVLFNVQMNNEQKMLQFNRSTLTLEYSFMELKRLILQEFKISRNLDLKIYFDDKKKLILNDISLRRMIKSKRGSSINIQVEVIDKRMPCILCMRDTCEHMNTKHEEKKRKSVQKTLNINILEPEKSFISIEKDSISTKKRKINCRDTDLSISQELSIPQFDTYIF